MAKRVKQPKIDTSSEIIKEKLEKGEISEKEVILDSLPKEKEKEYVYLDKEIPVVKEVRILKDNKEVNITEVIKAELDIVDIWEFMQITISEINLAKLNALGKEGWKFVFTLSPEEVHGAKTTTFYFQRPKRKK